MLVLPPDQTSEALERSEHKQKRVRAARLGDFFDNPEALKMQARNYRVMRDRFLAKAEECDEKANKLEQQIKTMKERII